MKNKPLMSDCLIVSEYHYQLLQWQSECISELKGALIEATEWNWLDDDAPNPEEFLAKYEIELPCLEDGEEDD